MAEATPTTPAQELRAAVTALRCRHSFPINPPDGSLFRPGPCRLCGTPWKIREPVPDWLRERLADWLEEEARQDGLPPCDDPTGVCNRCEWDPTMLIALPVARAINGGGP